MPFDILEPETPGYDILEPEEFVGPPEPTFEQREQRILEYTQPIREDAPFGVGELPEPSLPEEPVSVEPGYDILEPEPPTEPAAPPEKEEASVAEELGESVVQGSRIVASKIFPTATGLITFPARIIGAASEGWQAFTETADPGAFVEGVKRGFMGEGRDFMSQGAQNADLLAKQTEDFVKGDLDAAGQIADRFADQIITAAIVTWVGAGVAKSLPGIQQSAKNAAKPILAKAKSVVGKQRELKLSGRELMEVKRAMAEGPGAVNELPPKLKAFHTAVMDDAATQITKLGTEGEITVSQTVWPWTKAPKEAPTYVFGPAARRTLPWTPPKTAPRISVGPAKVQPTAAPKPPTVPVSKAAPPTVAVPPVAPKPLSPQAATIVNLENRIQQDLSEIADPAKRARVAKKYMDDILGDYGVTTFVEIKDVYRDLEAAQIPYVYERSDGLNVGGLNKLRGSHPEADKDLRAVWGETYARKLQENGAILARNRGDEFIAIWPEKTIDEVEKIRYTIEDAIINEVQKRGLADVAHPKHGGLQTGALETDFGLVEVGPNGEIGFGKPGEVDRLADKRSEQSAASRLEAIREQRAPTRQIRVQPGRKPEGGLGGPEAAGRPKPPTPPVPTPPAKPQPAEAPEPDYTTAGFLKVPTLRIETPKSRVPEPAKKAHAEWVAEKQVRELESGKAINRVIQKAKPKEREIVPFLIEKTAIPDELGRPDLQKILADPKKRAKLEPVAKEARQHFREMWDYLNEHLNDLSAQEIENYVTHIWDIPKSKIRESVNWFATRNPFLKKRFLKTYEEGIKRGYKPKTLDIARIMHTHDQYAIKTTENIKLVEAIKDLQDAAGVKLIMRSDKAPQEWPLSDHPVLRRALYMPGEEPTMVEGKPVFQKGMRVKAKDRDNIGKIITLEGDNATVLFVNKRTGEQAALPFKLDQLEPAIKTEKAIPARVVKLPVRYHPDLKPLMDAVFGSRLRATPIQVYEAIGGFLKKTQLSFSWFHHAALGETAVATIGPVKTAKLALNPAALYRALAENKFDIYGKKFEVAKDAVRHTLQLGAISDVQRSRFQNLLQNTEDRLRRVHPWAGEPVHLLRKFNDVWDKALWDYYHNNLKLYTYEHLVGKELTSRQNLSADQIDGIKREIAQFVNDTYGGQNWEAMMANPKTLQIAQWALLSPDWTLSTMRQALAPTGIGRVAPESRRLRMKMGAAFWARAALYFGVGINLLNYALTRQDNAKQREVAWSKGEGRWMWDNDPGHKTHLFVGRYDDGTKRYVRWGKQFRELPEMIYDQQAAQISPFTASLKKIGGKANPVLQITSLLATGHTLSGFKNRELAEAAGWPWMGAAIREIARMPLPFAFKNTLNETKQFKATDLAFPSSKGMTWYKSVKLFKAAITRKRFEDVGKIFRAATENNLNAWSLLDESVRQLKSEASSEIQDRLRRKGLSQKMLDRVMGGDDPTVVVQDMGTTPRMRIALAKELERNARKQAILENWDVLMEGALERVRGYQKEEAALDKEIQ